MILYFWAYLSTRGAMLTLDEAVMYFTPSAFAIWKPRSMSSSVKSFRKLRL